MSMIALYCFHAETSEMDTQKLCTHVMTETIRWAKIGAWQQVWGSACSAMFCVQAANCALLDISMRIYSSRMLVETSLKHSHYICNKWQCLQSKFTRGKNRGFTWFAWWVQLRHAMTACTVSLALNWGIPGGSWRLWTRKRETFEMQDVILCVCVAIWAHNDTEWRRYKWWQPVSHINYHAYHVILQNECIGYH